MFRLWLACIHSAYADLYERLGKHFLFVLFVIVANQHIVPSIAYPWLSLFTQFRSVKDRKAVTERLITDRPVIGTRSTSTKGKGGGEAGQGMTTSISMSPCHLLVVVVAPAALVFTTVISYSVIDSCLLAG